MEEDCDTLQVPKAPKLRPMADPPMAPRLPNDMGQIQAKVVHLGQIMLDGTKTEEEDVEKQLLALRSQVLQNIIATQEMINAYTDQGGQRLPPPRYGPKLSFKAWGFD